MRLLLGALLVIVGAGCGSTSMPLGQPPQKIVAGFYSCPAEAPTLAVRDLFSCSKATLQGRPDMWAQAREPVTSGSWPPRVVNEPRANARAPTT